MVGSQSFTYAALPNTKTETELIIERNVDKAEAAPGFSLDAQNGSELAFKCNENQIVNKIIANVDKGSNFFGKKY